MLLRNNSSKADDLFDQLLTGTDDPNVSEIGGMRGSLKKVLTEQALIAKSRSQRTGSGSLWRLFALRLQPQPASRRKDVRGLPTGT